MDLNTSSQTYDEESSNSASTGVQHRYRTRASTARQQQSGGGGRVQRYRQQQSGAVVSVNGRPPIPPSTYAVELRPRLVAVARYTSVGAATTSPLLEANRSITSPSTSSATSTILPTASAATSSSSEEEPLCLICYESVTGVDSRTKKTTVALQCYHVFHQRCIDRWFNTKTDFQDKTCPTCKAIIQPKTMVDNSPEVMIIEPTSASRRSSAAPTTRSSSPEVIIMDSTLASRRSSTSASSTGTDTPTDVGVPSVNTTVDGSNFSHEEMQCLLDQVDQAPGNSNINWRSVASYLNGRFPGRNRTGDGCRRKYLSLLSTTARDGETIADPNVRRALNVRQRLIDRREEESDNISDMVQSDMGGSDLVPAMFNYVGVPSVNTTVDDGHAPSENNVMEDNDAPLSEVTPTDVGVASVNITVDDGHAPSENNVMEDNDAPLSEVTPTDEGVASVNTTVDDGHAPSEHNYVVLDNDAPLSEAGAGSTAVTDVSTADQEEFQVGATGAREQGRRQNSRVMATGRRCRGSNFSHEEIQCLLDQVDQTPGKSNINWRSVASYLNGRFPGRNRTGDGCRRKYLSLLSTTARDGETIADPNVRRALNVRQRLIDRREEESDNISDMVQSDMGGSDLVPAMFNYSVPTIATTQSVPQRAPINTTSSIAVPSPVSEFMSWHQQQLLEMERRREQDRQQLLEMERRREQDRDEERRRREEDRMEAERRREQDREDDRRRREEDRRHMQALLQSALTAFMSFTGGNNSRTNNSSGGDSQT